MKRLLFIPLLFLFIGTASAQIALVAHVESGNSGGMITTTGTVDTSGANFLICSVAYAGSAAITLTDSMTSPSNTWHGLTVQDVGGNTLQNVLFYAYNAHTGASHTFTASGGTAAFAGVSCSAFSGVDTSSPFDQESGANSVSATSLQPGSLTPSQNGSLFITGLAGFFTSAPAIDSSFLPSSTGYYVVLNNPANYSVGSAYFIQTTAAAKNPTWNDSTASKAVTMAVFKPTAVCTPDHLTVTDQPANADLGATLGTIVVEVKDSGGTTCTSDTSTVTLAKTGGTCTGMTLGGTVSGAATAGVFTTTNVTLTVATGSCTLDATDGALTGATTSSVTIGCTPSQVVYDDFPASAALFASLGTTAASIRNSGNYTCINDSSSTITLSENTASTWGDLHSSSNLAKTVTAGVATWTDLYVDRSIGAGSVNATSSGLTLATSPSIDITTAGGPDTIVDGPFLNNTDNVTTSYYTHGNTCFLYTSYFTNPIDVPTDNKSNSFVLKAVVEAPIGHEFSAWYMDATCTTGAAHVVTTVCTASANCYPHTRLITYTFSGTATYVDSESGINDTGTTSVTTDAVTTVSSGNLALLGVTFLGVGSTNPMVDSSFTDDDGFLGAILVTAYKNGSLGSTEAPTLSWTTGQGATALIMIINNGSAPTSTCHGAISLLGVGGC